VVAGNPPSGSAQPLKSADGFHNWKRMPVLNYALNLILDLALGMLKSKLRLVTGNK
jgi:hypothetical protein